SADQIKKGIEKYTPQNNRSQVSKTTRNTVIADFYNANASSMAAALTNMEIVSADKKVVILGDMFEMGEESASEHRTVIRQAETIPADLRIFVGRAFYQQDNGQDHFFATTDEAAEFLKEKQLTGCFILLKGSRGMAFEKLMETL
ncbi:hypothetical protein M8994_20765, partial [Brucella sp. 21LCYQ03]|nr:hypothetical protein [Brucella sp. 21LCYQ03]